MFETKHKYNWTRDPAARRYLETIMNRRENIIDEIELERIRQIQKEGQQYSTLTRNMSKFAFFPETSMIR